MTSPIPQSFKSCFQRFSLLLLIMAGPGLQKAKGVLAFNSYVNIPTGSWPEAVAIADFNGDGRNDVVLTTSYYSGANNNSALVFLQNSSGGLESPVAYSAGGEAVSVAIGDFNGDGATDIAVGKDDLGIRVLWNTQGTFNTFTDYPTPNAYKICAGDFNHDGLTDLAGIGWSASMVDLFLQQKEGGLISAGQFPAPYSGYNDIEAGDVNNDGLDDIVVMSGQTYATPNVSVLLQTQTGFATASPYTVGPSQLTEGIAIADVNGDGRNDVLASYGGNRPRSQIAVFSQTGGGVLNLSTNYASYDVPETLTPGDVDMDGRLDIVVMHGGWSRAGVYLQTTAAKLATEQLFVVPYASHYNVHGLAIGDINSDGRPDLVIADYNYGLVILYNASTPPSVRISRIQRKSSGNVTLTIPYVGSQGTCVVERAVSLGDWKEVGIAHEQTWTDRESAALPACYYRLRLP